MNYFDAYNNKVEVTSERTTCPVILFKVKQNLQTKILVPKDNRHKGNSI